MALAVDSYPDQMDLVLEAAEGRTGEGPSWLKELRRRSLAAFREQGIPSMGQEEWKYTSLRGVAERPWKPVDSLPDSLDFEAPFAVEGSLRVVLVNGWLDASLSSLQEAPGLIVSSLASALRDHGSLVEGHLGRLAKVQNHPFAALNTALFTDGVFVHAARGASVEQVIEIVHVSAGSGFAAAPRVLVVAEEGARIKLTERYVSLPDAACLVLPVTEVHVGAGASVEMVRLQDEGQDSSHIGLWEGRTEEGSEYLAYNVAFGGRLHRLDQNIFIAGEHAQIRLDGVACADGIQLLDNHTGLDHAVPNCTSFEVYKQIVNGEATVVFNGKIYVHQDAQKTDAKQTNQALLLSPNATINSKPQLEIFADDVKCTHGATVGQLEEEPRFYMMSRGMPRKQAEAMLVYAFAAEVLELISIAEVKRSLEDRLFEKLGTEQG